jgi:hypothetical protein
MMRVPENREQVMPRPPLPILTTVAESYRLFVADLLTFVHATAGWCALLVGSQAVLMALAQTRGQRLMAMIIGLALFFMTGVAVAITWHRHILLKEAPRGPLPIRWDAVPRYVANVALIIAIIALAAGAIGTAVWFLPPTRLSLIVMLVAYVAAFLTIGRLLLVLPAAAVGEHRMTPRASWAFTVNNSWRLFAGLSLAAVPPIAIASLAQAGIGERLPQLAAAIGLALSFINMALVAGFASVAYRHFTETARTEAFD